MVCRGPLIFAWIAVVVGIGHATPHPKNILMVVIDDLGFDDMGFRNGGQIPTTHFDNLAKSGIVLEKYYVQASCSPTRATFMTGRKPVHTGINKWIPDRAYGLPLKEATVAQVLNARGFKSHAIGKWHLGFHKSSYTPTFRGFDSFYGYYEGEGDYFTHEHAKGFDLHLEEGKNCGPSCSILPWDAQGTYSTNLFTERAVRVIKEHDVQVPLFIYLAYQGVHEPSQSPQHYINLYGKHIADKRRRVFAGMLGAIDEGMGNVSQALRAKGIYDDTLIVVTTDNGGPTTECSTTGQSNWPYRGSKCSIWEGGTRGLGFLYWSGLPLAAQGTTWTGLAHAADWLPTFVAAAGGTMTDGETLPLDGVSLWSALVSKGASPRTEIYYGISQTGLGPAVRDVEGFKLILGGSGGGKGEWSPKQLPGQISEGNTSFAPWSNPSGQLLRASGKLLFSLPEDVGERNPLDISKNAKIVSRLQNIVNKFEATKVPQASSDPSCPHFAPRDSPKGKWIGPYCDGKKPPSPPSPPTPPSPPSPPSPSECGTCKVCFNPTSHKCQDQGAHPPKTKSACEGKHHIWCGPSTFEEYV